MASVATSLGRVAAHSGQEITFDDLLKSEEEYARARTSGRWIRRPQ